MKLILASGSVRRRELLTVCGYDYEVMTSGADEALDAADPRELVTALALRKARAVYERAASEGGAADTAVLGADTVVVLDGRPIGKPADTRDAERILAALSGRTHSVYTGAAVVSTLGESAACDETRVTVKRLEPAEIAAYAATGEPLDKAGAYGIQGAFGMFVEKIEGNYFNVVGLPLPVVYDMLKGVGIFPRGFGGTPK